MQTAASPSNSGQLVVPWVADPADVNQYFYVLHISEIFDLAGTNDSRSFDIRINNISIGNLTPDYLYSDAVLSTRPLVALPSYNITLDALSSSTLPPILNAVEIYSKMRDQNVASEAADGTRSISILLIRFIALGFVAADYFAFNFCPKDILAFIAYWASSNFLG